MDRRTIDGAPSGDSRTGRRLFTALPSAGFEILRQAPPTGLSCLWATAILPTRRFLHFIVDTIHGALTEDPALNTQLFTQWIALRKQQIDRHELTYLAKQYDFLVRRNVPASEAALIP